MEPLKPADPTELGGIVLRGRLGRGGMGTVFYGINSAGEQVALKMIRDDLLERSEALSRFSREGLAIGMVQGPRVANLVALSAPDETPPWLAVEYVQGLTLAEYVAQVGPLPAALAAALGLGVAEALAAVHDAGILHRDLKPGNILLSRDGPKVIDFGLAALTSAPGDLTRTTETIGTPVCMAPEQVTSAKDLTAAAEAFLSSHKALAATARKRAKNTGDETERTALTRLAGLADRITDDDSAKLAALVTRLQEIGVGPRSAARAVVFSESVHRCGQGVSRAGCRPGCGCQSYGGGVYTPVTRVS